MNLGKYEIETYTVMVMGLPVQRKKIRYTSNNGIDFFDERFYGEIREGYVGSNTKFVDLTWGCIKTHVIGETVLVVDRQGVPLIYLTISSIQSIQKSSDLEILILDSQVDPVTLSFLTQFDSSQAYSMLNYLLQNPMIDLNGMSPDTMPPQVFFNELFFGSPLLPKDDVSSMGSIAPYSTDDCVHYVAQIDSAILLFPVSKSLIISELVYDVVDNRDDNVVVTESDITIYRDSVSEENEVDVFDGTGMFIVKLSLVDLVGNTCVVTIESDIQ
jgi:hypothetical protein